MAMTPNPTLPQEWDSTHRYNYGDQCYFRNVIFKSLSNNNINHNPWLDENEDFWKASDIYKKDLTVMPHGEYSGDQSLWDRDQLYIDDNGDVYINGLKSGINTRGPAGSVTIDFSSLTPEQIEQIRGPQGVQGPQGIQGIQGPQGPMGEVVLTPEQTAALKGDDGKSAYDIWIEQGYTGTEDDFLNWLRTGIITLDEEMLTTSTNALMNKTITNAFNSFTNQTTALVNALAARVEDLENRLKSTYQGDDIYFRFGVTSEGKYGYYTSGTDTINPFNTKDADAVSSQWAERNDLSVFQKQFGYGNVNVAMTTIESQLTEEASLTNNPSGTDEDPTILYGATQLQSLAEVLPPTYLYKDGVYNPDFGYNLYGIDNSTFISNGEEDVEGIYFTPNTISQVGGTLYITVAPVNEEDTIYYQIGNYSDSRGKLPEFVTTGAYRSSYVEGSFDEETTLSVDISGGKGAYFASTIAGEFEIVEIYMR